MFPVPKMHGSDLKSVNQFKSDNIDNIRSNQITSGHITKELQEKAIIQFHGAFYGLKISN